MKSMKNPFSPFDIFTSIIPAIIMITSFYVVQTGSPSFSVAVHYVGVASSTISAQLSKSVTYTFFFLISISLLFCVGHAIMSAASLFIDRLFVGQGLTYPYVHLFNLPKSLWDKFSSHFYLSYCTLFVIFSSYLLVNPDLKIFSLALKWMCLIAMAKIVIGEIRNWYYRLNRKRNYVVVAGKVVFSLLIGMCFLSSFVTQLLINTIRSLFRMERFGTEFRRKFAEVFEQSFGFSIDTPGMDSSVFWLPYVTIHEATPSSAQTLHFIRTLYYFSRNLSMAFFLCFVLAVAMSIVDGKQDILVIYGFVSLFLSVIFFIYYYNIYYNHYTKQTFRAFFAYATASAKFFPKDNQCNNDLDSVSSI